MYILIFRCIILVHFFNLCYFIDLLAIFKKVNELSFSFFTIRKKKIQPPSPPFKQFLPLTFGRVGDEDCMGYGDYLTFFVTRDNVILGLLNALRR